MATRKKAAPAQKKAVSVTLSNSPTSLEKQVGGDHYKKYPIQPIELFAKDNIRGPESFVIKYVMRHQDKNGLEDIKKAIHTLQLIAEMDYGEIL